MAVLVLMVTTLLSVIVLAMFSSMMARITYTVDYGQAAYYAATACLEKVDDYPISNNVLDASCTTGDVVAIDFSASNSTSIVCDQAGEAATVLALGSNCSCIAEINDVSDTSAYPITVTGECSESGNRGDENSYRVSINKTLSGCPTCTQMCPVPGSGNVGDPCGACGVPCDNCCALAHQCNVTTLLCD